MSSTYSSADTVFSSEKPCLSCGTPTTETMPNIRGKAYLCTDCQDKGEEGEDESKDVIFDGSSEQEEDEVEQRG